MHFTGCCAMVNMEWKRLSLQKDYGLVRHVWTASHPTPKFIFKWDCWKGNLLSQSFVVILRARVAGARDIMDTKSLPFPRCWKQINPKSASGHSSVSKMIQSS